MPRPSNTRERRAQITTALGCVMAARGYDGATIAVIAQEAGLSPGLVHYHFDSKQQIVAALAETLTAVARQRIAKRLAAAGAAPRARLDAFVDAMLAPGEDAEPAVVATWSLLGAEAVRQPEIRRVFQPWLTRARRQLTRLVAAAFRDAGRSADDAAETAVGLLATIEGYYALAVSCPGFVPKGSAARVVRRMLAGLLVSQRSEPSLGGST